MQELYSMRKPDELVKEVVCSETGKPMPKIPLWMAEVKVKFISDEARQKHPALPSLADIEPIRRGAALEGDSPKAITALLDDDTEIEDEETADEDEE
jgi:hypothetical protein